MSFIYGINIEGYKLFSEKVNFRFAPITILTGKNNSGKSTLSSAIRLLSSLFPDDITNHEGFNEHQQGSIDIKKIIRPISNEILPSNTLYFKNLLPYNSSNSDISFEIPVNIGAFQLPQKLKLVYEVSPKQDSPLKLKELLIYLENKEDDWIYKIALENEQYYQQINYKILLDDYRNFYINYRSINKELKKLQKNYHIIPDENKLNQIKKKLKSLFGDSLNIYFDDVDNEFIIYNEELIEIFPGKNLNYNLPEEYFLKFNVLNGFSNILNLLDPVLIFPEKKMFDLDTLEEFFQSEGLDINALKHTPFYNLVDESSQNDFLINQFSNLKLELSQEGGPWAQIHCLHIGPQFNVFKVLEFNKEFFTGISFIKLLGFDKFTEFGERFFTYYNNALRNVFKNSLCFRNIYQFNISDVELVKSRFILIEQNKSFKEELLSLIDDDKSKEYQFICYWMKKFDTGDAFRIERDENIVRIKIIRGNEEYLLSDNGFGHSKILPLLFKIVNIARKSKTSSKDKNETIISYTPSILILEEPEVGLHPALQSTLAELFFDAFSQFNIQFIIETHSEYIVRKYQEMVVNPSHSITKDHVQIHYFYHPDSIPEGEESQVFPINIEEDGALTRNFGNGFFDESSNLNLAVYNYSKINQN